MDVEAFEAKLGAWAHAVIEWVSDVWAPRRKPPWRSMAKPFGVPKSKGRRGRMGYRSSHRLGLTLTQQAVDDKTNEIKQVETVASLC